MVYQLVRLELNDAGVVITRQPTQPLFELRDHAIAMAEFDAAHCYGDYGYDGERPGAKDDSYALIEAGLLRGSDRRADNSPSRRAVAALTAATVSAVALSSSAISGRSWMSAR
jgi:hypothetical protein